MVAELRGVGLVPASPGEDAGPGLGALGVRDELGSACTIPRKRWPPLGEKWASSHLESP